MSSISTPPMKPTLVGLRLQASCCSNQVRTLLFSEHQALDIVGLDDRVDNGEGGLGVGGSDLLEIVAEGEPNGNHWVAVILDQKVEILGSVFCCLGLKGLHCCTHSSSAFFAPGAS
jgi:hypothetical protein